MSTSKPIKELQEDFLTNPAFFELLDKEDQVKYKNLRTDLSSSDMKFKRYKRITSFNEALQCIYKFCIRQDSNDWKRQLVCGICWINFDIGINTRQLRLLINKSKSSINGALAKMGYGLTKETKELIDALTRKIPILKENYLELRQWTVRRKNFASPVPQILMATPQHLTPTPADFISETIDQGKENFEVFNIFGNQQNIDEAILEDTFDFLDTEPAYDSPSYSICRDPCTCTPNSWYALSPDEDEIIYKYE